MCADTTTIRTPDQRVRVFISSTLEELAPERAAARAAIDQLRLTPVLFEAGARAHPPRDLYRAYVAQSEIFIGIYWQRYGWLAPGADVSGLEDEYRLAGDRPRLIYIKTPAPEREQRLQALLDRIKADDVASYRHFADPSELRKLIADDLALLLTERFESAAEPPDPEPPASLPAFRGVLVDREHEISATRALLLRDDVGLVTLTGPGGVGKTRVAVRVASDLAPHFADGVAFIPLDTLTDPARLPRVIAQALRIPEVGSRSLEEVLLSYLRPRQMLILLDNVEQLIAAAPLATQALDAAPQLKILATSREPLRVRNEYVVPIPLLALPDHRPLPALPELARIPSVTLFVERAREYRPDFALTDENASAVAEICRRLDGLPLALELAAARLATLTPQAVLARLGRRLPLLTRGQRDLPARQQTLRTTIAWSYDLLDESEKTLFRRLGIFVGGFTLEAVEAVCLRSDSTLPSSPGIDALDGVSSLVDKSLVYRVDQGTEEPRFALLQLIREYATERLGASGEIPALQQRHAAYFVRLAAAAEPHLSRTDRAGWLERLNREDANLRAAFTWSTAEDDQPARIRASTLLAVTAPEQRREGATGPTAERTMTERSDLGIRLARSLAWYWVSRGQLREGREWLEALLARTEGDDRVGMRGMAQYAAGLLAWAQGDVESASGWAEAAVAAAGANGDAAQLAPANALLGLVRISQGNMLAARPLLEDSRAAFHALGESWYEAYTLCYLARAALMGSAIAEAQRFAEDSLTLFARLNDAFGRAMALSVLGAVAVAQGDTETAVARYGEAMPVMRATAGVYFLADFLLEAGTAWLAHGDDEQSQRLLTESLGLWRDMGRATGVTYALAGMAEVAAGRGQAQRAARLLGAAGTLSGSRSPALPPYLKPLVARADAAARTALGPQAFEAARAEGAALPVDQAIAEALGEPLPGAMATATRG